MGTLGSLPVPGVGPRLTCSWTIELGPVPTSFPWEMALEERMPNYPSARNDVSLIIGAILMNDLMRFLKVKMLLAPMPNNFSLFFGGEAGREGLSWQRYVCILTLD